MRRSAVAKERFLFDSGGGVSNITPEFAGMIGCKPWGQISGTRMTGQRLDMRRCDNVVVSLGSYQSESGPIGVFDLGKVLPGSMKGIDGTIAFDLFASREIRLSYAHHTLQILDPISLTRATAGEHSMPIHIVRDAEGMALTVNLPVPTTEGLAWFEVDSGNTSQWVLVGNHLAVNFQLDPSIKTPQHITFKLADGSSSTGSARVLDLILDGNLGARFLSHYDLTLDLSHALAWIHPVGPQIVDPSWFCPFIDLQCYRFHSFRNNWNSIRGRNAISVLDIMHNREPRIGKIQTNKATGAFRRSLWQHRSGNLDVRNPSICSVEDHLERTTSRKPLTSLACLDVQYEQHSIEHRRDHDATTVRGRRGIKRLSH
jgi:hypothetical protein